MTSKTELAIPSVYLNSTIRAIGWIERAQDADPSGGVPAVYTPLRGWASPYPETTGYIIPTFLALANLFDKPQLLARAIRMGEWLISIQYSDGAFPSSVWVSGKLERKSVFNSGQILFGLIALWRTTKDKKWQDAGLLCANWLLSTQDADGAWRRFTYRNTFHVYKTRVAWAMALAGKLWSYPKLVEGATRNIENALGHQDQCGWFENTSFDFATSPVLHTFVYTIQGVLESGLLLERQDFVDCAVLSSKALGKCQSLDGSLPGQVQRNFSSDGFRCLTGIAQQIIVWSRLHQNGDRREPWQQYSTASLEYLRKLQVNKPGHMNDGGFAGSHPIWAPYMRFRYPNWAVKFYIDAVIAHAQLMDKEAWG